MSTTVLSQNAMIVTVKPGKNPRPLYLHQVEAIQALNGYQHRDSFRTLVVLPTGAGKTRTAADWLLNQAVDKKKKVLWIAHRRLLLEQAAEAFTINAYNDILLNRKSFKYRIVSGEHDRPSHIRPDDDILIVSKDSIIRSLGALDAWLEQEETVYLVIDEAHHATARSYRRIIDGVAARCPHIKMVGLTATPFRTSEQEQGLLGKIFLDDIAYKEDLVSLIKKGILSTPYCESCDTDIMLGDSLGLEAIKSIERIDAIPSDIADDIASNAKRNRFIAATYAKNYERYGQTLVFALNRMHALTLKAIFEQEGAKQGIKAGVIMTGTSAEFIGIDVSNEENTRQIEAYRNGEIQVLINVNILTEGVDLPKTQTVFLTRPTVSTVLMTQMIGRALRGERAGGTKDAFIVSFVDNWNNKIAWVNPQSILDSEDNEFSDKDWEHKKRNIRIISIEKIEEFARIVNDSIDTTRLEAIDFIKRVPLGMYVFTFIDENNIERNHQILVYDNSMPQYQELIQSLPILFREFAIDEEVIPVDTLRRMIIQCENAYFDDDMLLPYVSHVRGGKDLEYLFKYYAQKESAPLFIPFSEVDRKKVDLGIIAKKIVGRDMRRSEQAAFINSLWEDETSLLRIYFGNKYFFKRQLETEIDKCLGDYPVYHEKNTVGEEIPLETLPLYEISKLLPEKGRAIKQAVYDAARQQDGSYCCAQCGKLSFYKGVFQIDHITPMAKGGLTETENLQLLCRMCNLEKSDH